MFHLTLPLLSLASGSCCWFSWWLFSVEQWSSASSAAWGDSKMVPKDAPWLFMLLETWTPFAVSCLHTSRCPLWKPYSFVWVEKLIYEKQICKHRTRYSLLRTQRHALGRESKWENFKRLQKKKEKLFPGKVTQSWVWEQNLNLNIKSTSRREKVHRTGHSRWKQSLRYRRVSLGFWCPSFTLCSFMKLAMPHLLAIISNNAFQIVCFHCRAWNTLDCVSECQYSCPFSPDTLAVSWSSLLPTSTPKPCPFYYFFSVH